MARNNPACLWCATAVNSESHCWLSLQVRAPTHIVSSICDDRGEEPTYAGGAPACLAAVLLLLLLLLLPLLLWHS